MSFKKKNRFSGRRGPSLVDPVFVEHLESHRDSSGRGRDAAKQARKAQQLCRQVYQALTLTFGGACRDEVLSDLIVESVEPAPNASHLLVRLMLPTGPDAASAAEVLERLGRASGVLRQGIAASITRKRVPELSYMVVAPTEGGEVDRA